MRVIRRYLFRTIISTVALVMSVLLGLAVFIEFVTQLDDIGEGTYGILQALTYAFLKLPNLAYEMLPMATLLGSLLGLGNLANAGELVVLRAAGVSTFRLARSVFATGFVLALITLILGEYVGPPLDNYARQFRTANKHAGEAVATGASAWIRDRNSFLNVNRLGDDFGFGGIFVYTLDESGQLAGIGRADSAGVDDDGQWVLSNYKETQFKKDRVVTRQARLEVQQNNLNAELVGLTVMRPDGLSGVDLYRYINYLEANGLDARRYQVAFWARIAASVAVIPMCVLALPFVFGRMRRSGSGAQMAVGIGIGLAYFLISRGLADGGQVYNLEPLLVAWLPTVALVLVTISAVARAR